MGTMNELYAQYKGLIGYSAKICSRIAPVVDAEDLFQDGCVFLFNTFRNPADRENELVHNTFRKGLFLMMRSRIKSYRKLESVCGKKVLRFGSSRDGSAGNGINLEDMLADTDTSVLAKLYAREFVSELRRLLNDDEIVILDKLVENAGSDTLNSKWVSEVAQLLGLSDWTVYRRIRHIREVALRVLSLSA